MRRVSARAGRRVADGDTMAIVNSYMNPDWGIHKRETVSNSL
jgi:hypothetical protein